MRITLIGCVNFSASCLRTLLIEQANVVGVVTRAASSFNSDFCDLRPIAESAGIPCYLASGTDQHELAAWMGALKPEVIFCFGWSYLLKQEVLDLAPLGAVGYHPAALPANRGRHPLIWTLALGLEAAGSTFFFIDRGTDSGDILSQRHVTVALEDDASSLYAKLTEVAQEQIREFLPQLQFGTFRRTPQDHAHSNFWRKRDARDGVIDWRMSSRSIFNLVRALARPYPGAQCFVDGAPVRIWKVEPVYESPVNLEAGKVLRGGAKPIVKCGEGALRLVDHELSRELQTGDYI